MKPWELAGNEHLTGRHVILTLRSGRKCRGYLLGIPTRARDGSTADRPLREAAGVELSRLIPVEEIRTIEEDENPPVTLN